METGDETCLQPLYDLTEALSLDLQWKLFWPLYNQRFIQVFGATLLQVKDNPDVVKAGYTALSNIISRLLVGREDDKEGMTCLAILKTSLEGLLQGGKGLPNHAQRLCSSALAQIIRRSKAKKECIEFVLQRCAKCLELAAKILLRTIKVIEKSTDINVKHWQTVIQTIDANDKSDIWIHLVDGVAELTPKNIEICSGHLLDLWMLEQHASAEVTAFKVEVVNKVLHLCRGKKVKMEAKFQEFIAKFAGACSDDKVLASMSKLLKNYSSCPNQASVECMLVILKNGQLETGLKVALLEQFVQNEHFQQAFMGKFVQTLVKFPSQDESLELACKLLSKFTDFKTQSGGLDENLTVEFYCDNPSDPRTIPNRMLETLRLQSDLQVLKCTVISRPFCPELSMEILPGILEQALRNLKSDSDNSLETIFYAVKSMSRIMCHKDFLSKVVEKSGVLFKVSSFVGQSDFAAKILAHILKIGSNVDNWIERQIKGPLAGECLINDLVKTLGHPDPASRFWVLSTLAYIWPQDEVINSMLSAEKTPASLQLFRERAKFLSNLAFENLAVKNCKFENLSKYGIVKFLLAQLSVNFKPLWPMILKVVESHDENENLYESWSQMFEEANFEASQKRTNPRVDYANFRNQLLSIVYNCPKLAKVVEKNNERISKQFLDVFLGENAEAKNGDGLHSFLTVFGKFSNLRSLKDFDRVQAQAENGLGHFFAKVREASVQFFAAAFKDLRPHKETLLELVNDKKWKTALTSLPEELAQSDNAKISSMLHMILGAKLRQTAKDKRKVQLGTRKFLIRVIYQIFGPEKSLGFLADFAAKNTNFTAEADRNQGIKKFGMVFDVLIISASSAGGVASILPQIIELLVKEGQFLEHCQQDSELLLAKQRAKMMEHLLVTFQTCKDHLHSLEDQRRLLANCVWPLLNPSKKTSSEDKVHHMAKIGTMFGCWVQNYQHLFFEQINEVKVIDWIATSVLASEKLETGFKMSVCDVMASLVLKMSPEELRGHPQFLQSLVQCVKSWLSLRSKVKLEKASAVKLKAMTCVAKEAPEAFGEWAFFGQKLFQNVSKWRGEVQTEALVLLNCSSMVTQVAQDSFRLISSMVNREGRDLAAKLLWQSLDNVRGQKLNDNFLLQEEYKNLDFDLRTFLFTFHFAASEVVHSGADFAERNAAGSCLRHVVQRAKGHFDNFKEIVDAEVIPVLTKGLMSKMDRVQGEFIQVLTSCLSSEGHLGSLTDLGVLQSHDFDSEETNFFDNMRHLQKHRRSRAMKRLIKNLDLMSQDTCQSILLPMLRTYLFNPDYDAHTIVVTTAIEAIGALAARLQWKSYAKLLQDFLASGKQDLEPKYQKQRVKVLASILDAFHFDDVASMARAKAMLEKLLKIKSTTGQQTLFKDGVEETKAGDYALYVPIVKILMLLPSADSELNNHVSTLIVSVASVLRSRKREEREPARKILCEMAALLGPYYLPHIIGVLKAQLQRGYQLHVLVFSTHAVLSHVLSKFSGREEDVKALDLSIQPVMAMVNDELFANLNEEKKVAALLKKTMEANKTVSFNMLELLASHMSKSMLGPMLGQLLGYVKRMASFESGQKLKRAFKAILAGLMKNEKFDREDYLQLAYGLLARKLVSIEHKSLEEMAFGLLHAAANPGSNDSPLGLEAAEPFFGFVQDCLAKGKDLATSTACLKFLVALTQQSKAIVNALPQETLELVWKKCKLYEKSSPVAYGLACQLLKNLLTLNAVVQLSIDRIKTFCLFFKAGLEENPDDKSAMQLIGLLLFKYYTKEALEPYLKLLCSSGLRCRAEDAFGVSQTILSKIVQRHSACFQPALSFYIANIDVLSDVKAQARAIDMAAFLIEKFGASIGKSYDTTDLFLHSVLTYFRLETPACKKNLEGLISLIFLHQHGSRPQKLVQSWLGDRENVVNVGIGAKVMNVCLQRPGTKVKPWLLKALEDVRLLQEDDFGPQSALSISYFVELLKTLLQLRQFDFLKDNLAKNLAELIIHPCSNVRLESVRFFALLPVRNLTDSGLLRKITDNLCTLVKEQPIDALEMADCMANLALASCANIKEEKSLYSLFLKKTRGAFYLYETKSEPTEFIRRKLYYASLLTVLKNFAASGEQLSQRQIQLVKFVNRYLGKDKKQPQLEEVVSDVQLLAEKLLQV